MLDQNDIKKIGEEVGKVIEDNITPTLDKIHERLDSIDKRVDSIDKRVTSIEANMVTKSYLDDKLADLSGEVVVREKKLDQKVNLVIGDLEGQHVLRSDTIKTIKAIQVFPPPPQVA